MSLHRDDVWFGLLDADRVARYYNALAARLRRRRRLLDACTAFGSTGAAAALLLSAPTALLAAFILAVAFASAWSLVSRYSEDGALLTKVGDEMGRLAGAWQLLWSEVDALGDDEARRRVAKLSEAMARCTDDVPPELADVRRLNERCAAETYAVMQAQHGAATTA